MRIILCALLITVSSTVMFAQKSDTMTIKVFFHNEKLNPNMQDCNKAFPTTRQIPRTKAVATAALQELFKGTTKDEEAREFSSFTPEETAGILKNVNVRNGAAYVNFTSRMYTQMGNATTSCGGAFFTMIEKTLQQFKTIKKVYYAVEGDADGFYEWVQVGECPHGRHCSKKNFQ